MPLRRTPPSTPSKADKESNSICFRAISQSGSTPNLSIVETENITTRPKRKRVDDETCMEEIRLLLSAAAAQSETKFAALQASIFAVIAQNDMIKKTIQFVSEKYDDMILKVKQLELERKADRNLIQRLEETLESLERQLCSTKVEIKNIPKQHNESKENLCEIVRVTANALNIPIQHHDIKEVFRVNKKEDSSASLIVVEFQSVSTKAALIKGARQFNIKNKGDKLNTVHLKLEGPAKPVYLSERLTPRAQRLYYLARTFAKDNGFKFCWTPFGKIFLRQAEGNKQIPINSEADINNLRVNQ